jgi:hypothetical protein
MTSARLSRLPGSALIHDVSGMMVALELRDELDVSDERDRPLVGSLHGAGDGLAVSVDRDGDGRLLLCPHTRR